MLFAISILLQRSAEPYKLGSRVDSRLVDISARTGYALVGAKRTDLHAQASEYYQVFIFNLSYIFIYFFVTHILSSLTGNMLKLHRNHPLLHHHGSCLSFLLRI